MKKMFQSPLAASNNIRMGWIFLGLALVFLPGGILLLCVGLLFALLAAIGIGDGGLDAGALIGGALMFAIGLVFGILGFRLRRRGKQVRAHRKRLAESGTRATGTVVAKEEAGFSMGGSEGGTGRKVFALQVESAGPAGPFRIEHHTVSRSLGVGAQVTVAYEPQAPSEGIVVDERPQPAVVAR